MNHLKFGLYRRLLFLTTLEAAKNVARTQTRPDGVSERAWNRWESGQSEIPYEVARNLEELIKERQQKIESIAEFIKKNGHGTVPIYGDKSDIIAYKMEQSIAAQAAAMGADLNEVI